MSRFLLISLAICIFVAANAAVAESLWQDAKSTSLYADKRASKVGDILTVVIAESALSSQQASTNTKKESELSTGPGIGPLLERIPFFEYGGGDSMKAQGSTTRSSTLVARMTVTVVKVDPNGNLELEGTRFVQTNKEKAEIKLNGTIRPQDVQPDNTVNSACLANAKITYVGSGPIGSRQKEGLISKIFKILF